MNIIIPIGGFGSRFTNEKYTFPKPLINIEGHPMLFWLIDNLYLENEDTLFIAIDEEIQTNLGNR